MLVTGVLAGTSNLRAEAARDYDRLFRLGKKAYETRNFEKAIDLFTQSIDLKPTSAEPYLWRGNAFAEKKNPERERAMKDYDKAIAVEPQRAEAHFAKGLLHSEMGAIDEAIKEYAIASELKSDYATPLINRGQLLVAKKRYQEAIDDLTKAIKLNGKEYKGYYWRAYAWHYAGEERRAVDDFEVVIKAGVKEARFYNDLAWILATSNDPDVRNPSRAIKLALEAVKLDKDKKGLSNIYDTLATAYEKENQMALSKKYKELSLQAKAGAQL